MYYLLEAMKIGKKLFVPYIIKNNKLFRYIK
jgi:hypothetical protein